MNRELLDLVNRKQILENKIKDIIHGSIEIRNKKNNKYLYVHFRDNGKLITKYIGEYTDELHNLIENNNIQLKQMKKELKIISNSLKKYNCLDGSLDEKVKINIDFAKIRLVNTVYKQAILEGISTTYAETQNIIDGGIVNNMTTTDVQKIVNLKHAWEFVLNENVIMTNTNYYLLCEINKFVLETFYYSAGKLRTTPVKIGGSNWKPEIPIESDIKDELNTILNKKINSIDKSIELLLYVMKKQMFIDGNKRTAVIFANHYLISKGIGLIVIPEDKTNDFKKLLVSFYEGNDKKEIYDFLKDKCCYVIKECETN